MSDSGIASCLDAKTGTINWQKRLDGAFSASPLLAGGRIYFLSEQGTATVVQPGKTFELLATNSIDGITLASIAVSDGNMIIRSDRQLYCIAGPARPSRISERLSMSARYFVRPLVLLLALAVSAQSVPVFAQAAAPAAPAAKKPQTQKPTQKPTYEPQVGQEGKDVVWVPTPQALVDKMLDMAKVTPQDFLMDLGSGDGRTVITAAKRGVRATGIEYNPDMVELSNRNAAAAGVGDKVKFMKADLFETDLSQATVITMFLLPTINMKLRPAILNLKPGTRIVSNTFTMEDWQADETATIDDAGCTSWCTALLWIVPAKVEGSWHLPQGDLKLTQQFQVLTGSLGSTPINDGKVRGREVTFTAGGVKYTGNVDGNTMTGSATGGNGSSWTATRK